MKQLLILLMLVSQPAWADWVEMGQTLEGRDIYYVDPATLRKTADGRRLWTMATHDSPQTHQGVPYRSARELIEFDCAGERSRLLQQAFFSGPMLEGTSVYLWSGLGPWQFVAPQSVGELRFKTACRMRLK